MTKKKSNNNTKSPSFGGVGEAFGKASGGSFKILVIQQKMIGDVLTSSLICENLKLNFPDAEVHYLINRFTLPVVEGHPCIDEFKIFEKEHRESKIRFYKFLKNIAKENYTHVFDAYAKFESLIISRFSKAKYRFGFKKSYSKFYYSKTVKIRNKSYTEAGTAIENRLRLLKLMPNVSIHNEKPKIYMSNSELEAARLKLDKVGSNIQHFIMISALGSDSTKTYPLEFMADVLNSIANKCSAKLILNYMPSQQSEMDELLNYCDSFTQNQLVLDIEMKGLRDFMGVCSHCSAIIGNEGGAINIGKALDIPSFSIFSPWIIKEGWNSFELSHPNVSVHLSDYEKDLFDKKDVQFIKKNSEKFYRKLKPELIKGKLIDFLDSNVN